MQEMRKQIKIIYLMAFITTEYADLWKQNIAVELQRTCIHNKCIYLIGFA